MNRHTIFGNLGKDPVLTYTTSGTACAKFPVATSERWTDKEGNKQQETQWHNIIVWKKPAEIIHQYFKKGSQILLTGKVVTRSWDDNGTKKYMTETVLRDFEFVGKADTVKPSGLPAPAEPQSGGDAELPF